MSKKEKENDAELNSFPNEKYKKFFDKFSEIETLPIKQWKAAHLISYFCKKYKEHFNLDYQFKFNSPSPTKCYEVFRINTICSRLSSDPQILKDYIDWVFVERVAKPKKKFRSISFIANEELVNDYKINVLLANKEGLHLSRSSPLPVDYKTIMAEKDIQVSSYGDLAFFYQSIKSGGLDTALTSKFEIALSQMKEMGFDESILERII